MSPQTLPEDERPDESAPFLYIDDQNIVIQHLWALCGCVAPFALFWLGVLLCGALAGW